MNNDAYRQYDKAATILKSGNIEDLEKLASEIQGFPDGIDPVVERRWIINAIDLGSMQSVEWMLQKGVNLNFRDEEGMTPLHSAIDREGPDKHAVLERLLVAGAPVNLTGWNDWTPAHIAAARNDVEALRLLIYYGADLSIRMGIVDDYATPLEEARAMGAVDAVKYLETLERESRSERSGNNATKKAP